MRTENLLIELGTEELPPKALKQLGISFKEQFEAALCAVELGFTSVEWFAAPRRLALKVVALEEAQKDRVEEKRGPAVSVAFDAEGNPTKAAQGWARGNGIEVADAERLVTDKGEWLLYRAMVKGKSVAELIEPLVNQALSKLPIPKPMRWGSYETQFIRPVHSFCALYGAECIEAKVLGKASSRIVLGHRFHGNGQIELNHADDYLQALKAEYVIADFSERKQAIQQQIDVISSDLGLVADYDNALLDEIASLVEWPLVLQASFESRFLSVPKEALIYTMKDDQKYIPLLDEEGELVNTFLFVTNIESKDPSQVISGNEKVIRPRLADAEFFFVQDKKHTLESRLSALDSVLFQKQLGSLKDKSDRIAKTSRFIASLIGCEQDLAERAGLLCKTDLMTNMVSEFPDVQGVMGMYYAQHDGEDPIVAKALYEQYLPRFAGDSLPTHNVSACVSLADKLDTLVGIFGIGQLPKGDKDPFALRRAAIGLLRIITECQYDLDLVDLVSFVVEIYGDKLTHQDGLVDRVVDFVLGRFVALLQDENTSTDIIQAVAARRPTKPLDYYSRVKAVSKFKSLDEADALAAANKRVANILSKQNVSVAPEVSESLFTEDQEKSLFYALANLEADITHSLDHLDYENVLMLLSGLRQVIDEFFDNVMVMADDEAIKQNRLALLFKLRQQFLTTADISLLSQ